MDETHEDQITLSLSLSDSPDLYARPFPVPVACMDQTHEDQPDHERQRLSHTRLSHRVRCSDQVYERSDHQHGHLSLSGLTHLSTRVNRAIKEQISSDQMIWDPSPL